MIRKFESIEELNIFYAQSLKSLAENAENVNDTVLQQMVDEQMKDWKLNLELMNLSYKFERKLYKKDKRFEHKQRKLDFYISMRKLKALYWKKWWSKGKMLKVFKEQCSVALDSEIKAEKSKLAEMIKKSEQVLLENKTADKSLPVSQSDVSEANLPSSE